jgi:hypothetical protein
VIITSNYVKQIRGIKQMVTIKSEEHTLLHDTPL